MSKLLIFGAGASRNYLQAAHNVDEFHMPLDADFFHMSKKAIMSNPANMSYPVSSGIEHLLKHLNRLFPQSSTYEKNFDNNWPENALTLFDDKRLTLENILSMFYEINVLDDDYYEFLGGIGKNRVSTLTELIVFTLLSAQKGPSCDKHYEIAKNLNQGDILINFNYDTILDDALRRAGKLTDRGYFIEFSKVFENGVWRQPEQKDSDVTLFKLHGSLNLVKCKRCKLNFLLRTIDVNTRFDMFEYQHAECIRCHTRSTELILIPPLIGKKYHEFGIDYLWSDANTMINNKIKDIDEIIIIGYSLPIADVTSTLLFRNINHGFLQKDQKPYLKIINPDKDIAKHFSNIFNSSKIEQFYSLDTFLDTI